MRTLVAVVAVVAGLAAPRSSVAAGENLAPNPGFEEAGDVPTEPREWGLFASKLKRMSLTGEQKRSGEKALRITTQGTPDGFQGCTFSLDVTPGEEYGMSAWVMSDRANPLGGTAHVLLVIEWKRADDREIVRTISPPLLANQISRLRWEQVVLSRVEVPAGAARAVFGVHLCEGKAGGKGAVLVDDITVTKR